MYIVLLIQGVKLIADPAHRIYKPAHSCTASMQINDTEVEQCCRAQDNI